MSQTTTKFFYGCMVHYLISHSRVLPLQSLKEILTCKKQSLPVSVCPFSHSQSAFVHSVTPSQRLPIQSLPVSVCPFSHSQSAFVHSVTPSQRLSIALRELTLAIFLTTRNSQVLYLLSRMEVLC